ncbi:hypothetical protein P175DRAFT_0533594 [Aspergillus ochraceoroseus IBT 24754]|uniref:Hyphal anastamosis-8 protein n=3 Tax=Aspergillus subgen. Nidulantes TaxID=2720870 RepID=A0A0F8VLZ8_9EURO|nr:uncharacterized protein P175DRAFT_0533594 [Aspergillus ochraceoroseus IBT 24754]KKK12371.1 hypothetical protein AOCH_006818 [Aspergillus ochraceoroseus]KKK24126.1 hypothetical protein ARAM_003334 [Aspergillus rambellii]PTU19174.1 hypothetical protein P175DRAFT_0533594 [Aspergillus ochraceoroseus IBT 24754]
MSPQSVSADSSPQTYEPATPREFVGGHNHGAMALPIQDSPDMAAPLKSPRSARFAEATAVHSPTDPKDSNQSPFADPPHQSQTPPDVSDVGFGYVNAQDTSHHVPPASPLKSALKVPGTPGRTLNPLSPTFREEFYLEKQEKSAEKMNAKDLVIKTRIRVAKIFLRFISFGCSIIVLAILCTTLTIFHTTRSLPSRSGLTPWSTNTNPWPQYMTLGVACLSLLTCLVVFWTWRKRGHKRAEKVATYYTIFSVGFFIFSLILWIVAVVVYQNAKTIGNGQDIWGWSCKNNKREKVYSNDIDYALLCRLQDWGLVCAVIEVVIEVLVILIYAVAFYRFWSKRRLAKSMDRRDKARSDLYLAQLRLQSAPNTPGFPYTPKSPWVSTTMVKDPYSAAENGEATPTQFASPRSPTRPQPSFQLQAPPIRVHHATPKTEQGEFSAPVPAPSRTPSQEHMGAAPGEKTYESVPIPGAYASPMTSSFPQGTHQ